MQKKTTIIALLLLSGWYFLTSAMRDPSNPPTGRTGAPSESTCAASNCHSGGSFTGEVSISGIPDTVQPGQAYTVTLTNKSNATRAGFELTCLDGADKKCGTLVAGSGCSVATASSRQYIRQSSAKTLSNGSASWSFTWTAPATASGNQATFYFVSLAANGNGSRTGDNVLQANKSVVVYNPAVATHEAPASTWVKLYPTVVSDVLQVRLLETGTGQLQVFDQQGRLAFETALTAVNAIPVQQLPKGLYLARIQTEGKQTTQKFIVP